MTSIQWIYKTITIGRFQSSTQDSRDFSHERNVQNKLVFNMGLKPCVEDWASGGSQSCAKEDAQSASRSSRAIRERDLPAKIRKPRSQQSILQNNAHTQWKINFWQSILRNSTHTQCHIRLHSSSISSHTNLVLSSSTAHQGWNIKPGAVTFGDFDIRWW